MGTADEFREYARECLQWADEAETDDQRQSFISMAKDWILAALSLDGAPSTGQAQAPPEP
jgi:hypothetical protein